MTYAVDLALALDPVQLARRAGLDPDPWQAELLRSHHPRVLLNCARQSGKSSTVAVVAVHAALYRPGSLVLLVSPSLRQSLELFRKAVGVFRRAGEPVAAEAATKLTLELANGSRVVCLPGSEATLRGFSAPSLIAVDEAARVPDELLIALTTPAGRRGWFFQAWTGEGDWQRFEVPATEIPRIAPAFLPEERAALGSWRFEQEYLCRFHDTDTQFLASTVIAAASDDVSFGPLPVRGGMPR